MVTPLTLVFHELASNSAKYGALAVPSGLLSLAFEYSDRQLRVIWNESGAAIAPTPAKAGYGSRLLTLTIERQLKGSFTTAYFTNGLIFEFSIPASFLS